jgi:GGDEF domain-containing protein
MREILHADLLEGAATPGEGRGGSEVRGRMELAHEEALRERAPLAVMRIAVEGLAQAARRAAGGRIEPVLSSLTSVLRSLQLRGDLLAVREQEQIVAVLTKTDAAGAESLARGLIEGARKLAARGSTTPLGLRLSIGIAVAQFDAPYWFQTLLAVAQEGVEVAHNSGGGRAVHSELYTLHQRRLERLSPDRPKPVMPPPLAHVEPLPAAPPARPAAAAAPARAPADGRAPVAAAPKAPSGHFHELEERVLTLAREWTEEALAKALAESHREHSSEIEKLERRISKLTRALEDAQGELVRSQAGATIDPGVASAYRTVQGLRDEQGTGAKREMLEKLFEANLELRTLLGGLR